MNAKTLLLSITVSLGTFIPSVRSWTVQSPATLSMYPRASLLTTQRFLCDALMASRETREDDSDDLEEAEDFLEGSAVMGPEKSTMTNYILDYLRKNSDDEGVEESNEVSPTKPQTNKLLQHTHCVAIPMENCHELMIELESIQRAILYHCPALVHACIPQATTRMPLLYVTAEDPSANERLYEIANQVVRKHLFRPAGERESCESNPFLLRFQSLEMDGPRNEVLQTVAKDENASILREMVEDLQQQCNKQGWTTEVPPDPHSDGSFRPRIPFMRLPADWDDILRRANEKEDDEETFLSSDEGGNGISPIFWFKWLEDDFGTSRMREVAVFKRREDFDGLDEQTFYLPYHSIELPSGDDGLTKQENKFRDYQEKRMIEAEGYHANTNEGSKNLDEPPDIPQDDILLSKTRDRLEELYNSPVSEETPLEIEAAADVKNSMEKSEQSEEEEDEKLLEGVRPEQPEDPNAIDDWMRRRIEAVVANREKIRSEMELSKPKDMPPVEENKVFKKYKEGTLAPSKSEVPLKPELPPFPSQEHCTGFWQVIASPTGFMVEEGDASRSDNLILRVDGTTAGGPILDQEARQKASGGTWRFRGSTADDAGLLIRLVIPPTKERVLVMEGRLEKASLSSGITMPNSAFGIPELEERKSRKSSELDNLLYCNGNVWIEDAVTKANREDIGSFSLMKIDVSNNPESYTITVPKPVRNQD